MIKIITLMKEYLTNRNYDIEYKTNALAIVKHSDDPWNNFNKFIAKVDGVYNYVEVIMGGYAEKKRVSCNNFETSCLLVLTMFVEKELLINHDDFMKSELKKYAEYVLNNSSDYWKGQFIIDKFASMCEW